MTDSAPALSPDSPTPKPAKKKRTWKQRIKITLIIVAILACLLRIAVNLLLPTVVRKVANSFDLDCSYDRMTLSLFSGNAHIWNLVLKPKSGGDSIVQAEYVQGNLSTTDLLRGRLVVWRAEVDGVKMVIDREPNGEIPLLKRFLSPAPAAAPEPKKESKEKPAAPNLQSPLRLDALRVAHVTTTWRDRSVSPTFETTLQTALRISDVGNANLPARLELTVNADEFLDTLTVEGTLHNTPTSIDADFNVLLRGLHLKPARGYLLPLGVSPIANDMTVRASAKLKAQTIPNSPDISAQLSFSNIAAIADTNEWASLKSVTLDAKRIGADKVEIGQLKVEEGRAWASRSEAGRIQVAGFELVPAVPVAIQPKKIESASVNAAPGAPAIRIAVDVIQLSDLQAMFVDQGVTPTANITAKLDDLSIKNIVLDPAQPESEITLAGSATFPNLASSVRWEGKAKPFSSQPKATLRWSAQGIAPNAIATYLQPLGITSELVDAAFTGNLETSARINVDGSASADAKLTGLTFADQGKTLLDFGSANLSGFFTDRDRQLIKVSTIDISGPTINVQRDPDGSLKLLGLRIAAPSTQPVTKTVATTQPVVPPPGRMTTQPTTSPAFPKVQLNRFAWTDVQLNFHDKLGEERTYQGRVAIEANDLVLDASATKLNDKPSRFRATLSLPKIVEQAEAKGTLQMSKDSAALSAELSAQGLSADLFAAQLKALGIDPQLKNGQFAAKAQANVSMASGAMSATADLKEVVFSDGGKELAGVDLVKIDHVELRDKQVGIASIEIIKPRSQAKRNADGTLEAFGVRLVPVPTTQPVPATPVVQGPPAPLRLPASPIRFSLGKFSLKEGSLALTDEAVTPALNTTLRGTVRLDQASLAANAPATLNVSAAIDNVIKQATVQGTLVLAPEAPSANLKISVYQIAADALAGYFPPGTKSTLRDGQFAMTLEAGVANHEQGGLKGQVAVSDLVFEDRAANVTWAKVGNFTLRAGRIDPAGDVIAIDEISSAGVSLEVAKNADGSMEAAGLAIGIPSTPTAPATQPAAPATQPAIVHATTQPAVDVAAMVADARRPLPLVTVNKIDLKLDRLHARGFTGADAKSVTLANVRLHNPAPLELAGANSSARPPIKLQVDGTIYPLLKQFGVAIESAPFAGEPTIVVDVNASGINGQGLTDVLPELAKTIDGKNLSEGTFKTRFEASINYGRRGPRDLDIGRGFTANFDLKPVEFRASPDGQILAGVESVHGEGIRIEPKRGNVIVKSIEVTKPIGRILRDEQGIHALGFVIPENTGATTQPSTAPAEPRSTVATPEPAKPAGPPVRPGNEIRIDSFTVTGVDLVVEDRTSKPHTIIPLRTLDLDVRDLSNQMPWTGKPVRFDLLCTADKVPLPARKGATTTGPATQTAEGYAEMRDLFSQVTANGRIGMLLTDRGANLTGWAKTSVNGFELLGVRGLAAPSGIKIGGGVFDESNDIRFKDDGTIETSNKIVFTNLSISEPANGPIQRFLILPGPLDFTINRLTDADGSITMNIPVTVKSGAIDTQAIIGPAVGAVAGVITTAVLAAPQKAIQDVGAMVGLDFGKKQPEQPIELSYYPGVATLEPDALKRLAALAIRMKGDANLEAQLHHQFSQADLDQATRRSSPPPADVTLITAQLRREKVELQTRRASLAAQARAELGSQSSNARVTLATLKSTDRQLAQIDNSLQQLLELLRPGAANQTDRRMRAASLSIAKARFDAIEWTLRELGVKDASTRLRRTNPQVEAAENLSEGKVTMVLVPKKH